MKITKIRSNARVTCFACDAPATYRVQDDVYGEIVTSQACADHAASSTGADDLPSKVGESIVIDPDADPTPAPSKKSTRKNTAQKETAMSTTAPTKKARPAAKKSTASKPAAVKPAPKKKPAASKAEAATPVRTRKPSTKKDADPAPATAPVRKRRPVATKGAAKVEADADTTKPSFIVGADFGGKVLYIDRLVKDGIDWVTSAKDARVFKTEKGAENFAVREGLQTVYTPLDEDDDVKVPTFIYTLRNGKKSTRKTDAPRPVAAND